MPESPEVEALVEELGAQLTRRAIIDLDVVEFRVAKTRARPPSTLIGERVTEAKRHGKNEARSATPAVRRCGPSISTVSAGTMESVRA